MKFYVTAAFEGEPEINIETLGLKTVAQEIHFRGEYSHMNLFLGELEIKEENDFKKVMDLYDCSLIIGTRTVRLLDTNRIIPDALYMTLFRGHTSV